jgi:hypothetical protein
MRSQMTSERRRSARERMLVIAEENDKVRNGGKAAASAPQRAHR